MEQETLVPQCQQCAKPFDSSAPSSDICPECAATRRSDSKSAARPGNSWTKSPDLRLRFPWLTLLLASLIVATYCLQVLASHSAPKTPYDPVLLAIGMKGEAVFAGQWWRLVSAIFVHIDLYHLVSNLCFLLLFGSIAESVFQRAGYVALWFLTGIAGSIVAIGRSCSPILRIRCERRSLRSGGRALGGVFSGARAFPHVQAALDHRHPSRIFHNPRILAGVAPRSFLQRGASRRPARRNDFRPGNSCSRYNCAGPKALRHRRDCGLRVRGLRENCPRQTRTTITSCRSRICRLPGRIAR